MGNALDRARDLHDPEWNAIDAAWTKANCGEGKALPPSSPLFCETAAFRALPDDVQLNAIYANTAQKVSYFMVKRNIEKLVSTHNPSMSAAEKDAIFREVWPYFYARYDSQDGKTMIDNFLATPTGAKLSPDAVRVLKNPSEANERMFQLMNSPYGVEWYGLNDANDKLLFFIESELEWRVMGGYYKNPKKSLKEDQAAALWPTIYNPALPNWSQWGFRRNPKNNLVEPPNGIGNPYWSEQERFEANKKTQPVRDGLNLYDALNNIFIHTGRIDPNCTYQSCFEPKYEAGRKGKFYDHPFYGGKEPQILLPLNPYNFPGAEDTLSGGAGREYRNPCDARAPLETILPVAASVIAGGIVLFLLPREWKSTYLLTIGASGGMYYLAQNMYGIDAITSIGQDDNASNASAIISTFGAAGITLFAFESGIITGFTTTDLQPPTTYGIAALAGAVGYMFLKDKLTLALEIGGGISAILTAPISFLETGLLFLTNGCAATLFVAPWECKCSDAVVTGGKSGIIDQILGPIAGTTGRQTELRKDCLQKEMQRGGWASTGKDENVVSKCLGVVMENPFACYTAQNWVYKEPITDVKRTDKQEVDMWNQISHCIDAKNPSFYPPQTEADKYCQTKYGEQFREGPNGTCKNFALPGPNNTDPIGLQDPGAYKGTSENESCSIL